MGSSSIKWSIEKCHVAKITKYYGLQIEHFTETTSLLILCESLKKKN
ncbi:hypothetical protein M0802_016411 [Mischocyttarus mexicanus]|nr:hypothetical protein M0802_016411 [Mischocyttarus mexicanus]